jgi:hypothetical protein
MCKKGEFTSIKFQKKNKNKNIEKEQENVLINGSQFAIFLPYSIVCPKAEKNEGSE